MMRRCLFQACVHCKSGHGVGLKSIASPTACIAPAAARSLETNRPHQLSSHRSFSDSPQTVQVRGKVKKLFTPGPLGVSLSVKEAMLRDVGSRDTEFIECIKFIRRNLLEIAGVNSKTFSCIPVQGSGSFAMDAAFQTSMPRQGERKALIIENGSYGKRMGKICESAGIPFDIQSFREDQMVDPEVVRDALRGRTKYDVIAIVHSETSSGAVNPVKEVGNIIQELSPDSIYIVDAISSFGGIPINIEDCNIDIMVSSANKCLQGVPGFAFVVARNTVMNGCKGRSSSLCLDLYDQVTQLDKTSQFRFTPPTHSMLAFKQALLELAEEGGIAARARRYAENRSILKSGMAELGFTELLAEDVAGYIITSFHYPKDDNFTFTDFYQRLNEKDLVIYPGKVLDADCFRIGCIGDLHPEDMRTLLAAIKQVCADMNIALPLKN